MAREFAQGRDHGTNERVETESQHVLFLEVGETITVGDKEYRIEKVSLAKDLGGEIWFA